MKKSIMGKANIRGKVSYYMEGVQPPTATALPERNTRPNLHVYYIEFEDRKRYSVLLFSNKADMKYCQ